MITTVLVVSLFAADPAVDPSVERARTAVNPFKGALKDALMKALETSPEAAIEVCTKRAPELAKEASKDGVTVGRSAFKLRNEANAPKPWVTDAMKELSKEKSNTPAFRVVKLKDGRVGYAEAIWTGAMCLACHGEKIAKPVEDKLKAAYPKDAARGFKEGDFRGVFWAELDAPQKK